MTEQFDHDPFSAFDRRDEDDASDTLDPFFDRGDKPDTDRAATVETREERAALRRAFTRASSAWNADAGPIEKTVAAGENLYFAAWAYIEALEEQAAA